MGARARLHPEKRSPDSRFLSIRNASEQQSCPRDPVGGTAAIQAGAEAAPKPLPPTPEHIAPPLPAPRQVPRTRPNEPPPHASLLPAVPYATSTCESGHWIDAVEGDGKIIKLEDGSIWLVEDSETVTTGLWLLVSEVVVCAGKMINSDDDESADVAPLSSAEGLGSRSRGYVINAAANDETFVINGNIFKARNLLLWI